MNGNSECAELLHKSQNTKFIVVKNPAAVDQFLGQPWQWYVTPYEPNCINQKP